MSLQKLGTAANSDKKPKQVYVMPQSRNHREAK